MYCPFIYKCISHDSRFSVHLLSNVVKSWLRVKRTNNESHFIDRLTSDLAHSNEEYIENQLDTSNVVGYQISKFQEEISLKQRHRVFPLIHNAVLNLKILIVSPLVKDAPPLCHPPAAEPPPDLGEPEPLWPRGGRLARRWSVSPSQHPGPVSP